MKKIFSLKEEQGSNAVSTSNKDWCSFLNKNGIKWKGDSDKMTYCQTVNFPFDGYYNFVGSCDDDGSLIIDGEMERKSTKNPLDGKEITWSQYKEGTGKKILDKLTYKKLSRADNVFVKAGKHAVICKIKNTVGEKGGAFIIEIADVKIFDLKDQINQEKGSKIYKVDNDQWSPFLKEHGVWSGKINNALINVATFDKTFTVNFPVDAFYHFNGSCDDTGSISLNGNQIVKILDYKKEYSATVFVKAGDHSIRCQGINANNNPAGLAVFISGEVQSQLLSKIAADLAMVTADNAKAEAAKANDSKEKAGGWVLVPATTLILSSETGYSVDAGNEYVGCELRVWVKVEATAEVLANVGLDGNNVSMAAGISYVTRIESGTGVSVYVGPVNADANGCVYTQAGAEATMVIEVGDKGVKLEGGAEIGACIGVEGEAGVSGGGVALTTGAGTSWGSNHFGVGGGGTATFSDGVVALGVSGDVAAFVGVEFDVAISIDTNKVLKESIMVYNQTSKLVNKTEDLAKKTSEEAEELAKKAAKDIENATNDTKKALTGAGYQIKDGVVYVGNEIANVYQDANGAILKVGSKAYNDVKKKWDKAEDIAKDVGGKIEKGFKDLKKLF
jgi:hypothetical protein